jgi:tyrocidine synthetase-3
MVHNQKILQDKLNASFSRFKQNTALAYGKRNLTYDDLEKWRNLIAHRIINKGIPKETFIGVLIDDRIDLIAAILGIVTAGAVFVPLDTGYPQKRLETMMDITDIRWIIGDRTNYHRFSPSEVLERKKIQYIFIEDLQPDHADRHEYKPPEVLYSPQDKIYIYFTSGSTGIPKGIVGKNEGLIHFINWEIETFAIDETFRFSQFTNPGFDVFLRDIFVPLCAGGTICIPRDIPIETGALIRWLDSQRINLMHCVPSLFRVFNTDALEAEHFTALKYVLFAGEKLIPVEFKNWYRVFGERIRLVNLYGPTETTLAKMFYLVQPTDVERKIMPVGKHIKGARSIVLNEKIEVCEKLVTGEIYIRTPYRTYGYLNDPALTAEKFVPNPFGSHPGDLLYKTGDLGRLLPDGNLELLGRLDRQVKIRGMRVELDEIEHALARHPLVKESVVIKDENPGKNERLLACLTTNRKMTGNETDKNESISSILKTYLSDQFPDYMIPADVVVFESIPRTPNGKVDYEEISRLINETKFPYVPPTNEIERKLVETWGNILGIEKIGITNGFFELGGNSLNVMSLITKIHKEFDARLSLGEIFNNTTIEKQARIIKAAKQDKYLSLEPVEKKEFYALSSAQRRLYFLYRMGKNSTVYNIPQVALLEGEFHKERAEETFRKIIKRHESFRTSFEMLAGTPVQRISDNDEVEFGISYHKASEAETREIAHRFTRPFELDKAPLLRIGLINIGELRYLLLVDIHHIVSDAASLVVLIKELMQFYQGKELPEMKNQYKDFSQWQNKRKEKEWISKQEAYWLKEFEEEVPVLDLPADYIRPMVQVFEGDSLDFGIGKEQMDKLDTLASASGTTMFMVLLAVLNVFFSKVSGQEDIVVGTAVEGRNHEDLRQMIGVFVNTLPLRNYPRGNKTFAVFLNEVRERTLKAFDNQNYQFEDLVEKVAIKRDASRNPLFDVMFQVENRRDPKEKIQGLKLTPYSYDTRISKFDLNLLALESKDHLHFVIDYCTKLFKRETVSRFVTFFMNILAAILDDPSTVISDIDVLPEKEKQQILYEFNDTGAEYPKNKSIHELVDEQAGKTPGNIAVIGPGTDIGAPPRQVSVTYGELSIKFNRLARVLRHKGAAADTIVGIMAERSVEMIIGILGILEAGAAYMPIDPEYPKERIDFMLKDSNARLLLSDVNYFNCQLSIVNCQLSINEETTPSTLTLTSTSTCRVSSTNPAYIIYTSGTTGKPKGVIIEHKNVVRLFFNRRFPFDFNHRDVWTLFHSFCFDFSVWEMYGALLFGGQLLVIPRMKARDPWEFLEILKRQHTTVLNQTPSAFYNLMPEALKQNAGRLNLRYVIFGGEALQVKKLKAWKGKYPGTILVNMFGITETTVHVTYREIGEKEIETGINTIGKPIPTLNTYIMDKYRGLAPIGTPGELWVGGAGVARGYLNRPELTAERFGRSVNSHSSLVISPSKPSTNDRPQKYRPNDRLYRSGDLVRMSANGDMEYLGRIDQQVQIRGFRIELGEIESQILNHNSIKEAVVLKREDEPGNQYLCAFIVPKFSPGGNPLNMTELKDHLSQKLPGYMIPSYFVSLENIPLTPNGKIDRGALVSLGKKLDTGEQYVAPGSIKEKIVAQTWKEVLKQERIGINDNFFDLGGNSLNIIQVISKLREQLDMEISIVTMFEFPTIRTFSQYLSRLNPGGSPQGMEADRDNHERIERKIDRSGAIESAVKSKLKQQARRKRRN